MTETRGGEEPGDWVVFDGTIPDEELELLRKKLSTSPREEHPE